MKKLLRDWLICAIPINFLISGWVRALTHLNDINEIMQPFFCFGIMMLGEYFIYDFVIYFVGEDKLTYKPNPDNDKE